MIGHCHLCIKGHLKLRLQSSSGKTKIEWLKKNQKQCSSLPPGAGIPGPGTPGPSTPGSITPSGSGIWF